MPSSLLLKLIQYFTFSKKIFSQKLVSSYYLSTQGEIDVFIRGFKYTIRRRLY